MDKQSFGAENQRISFKPYHQKVDKPSRAVTYHRINRGERSNGDNETKKRVIRLGEESQVEARS